MSGYTKLFGSILDSTVWDLPMPSKITWIAMLAMADRDGEVQAAIPGLAKRAGVSLEQCEEALAAFMAPDKYSRTKENDGRRIEEIDGGWRLLNYGKYREQMSADLQRERDTERKRRLRAGQKRDKAGHFGTVPASPDIAEASADPKAEADRNTDSSAVPSEPTEPAVLVFPCNGTQKSWDLTKGQLATWTLLYPGVPIETECRKALAWIQANGRKTAGGMPRFLVRWLNKQNDQQRGPAQKPPDPRCDWHRQNEFRPAFKSKPDCPRCKHFAAASGKRDSTPTELGEFMAAKARQLEQSAERDRLAAAERFRRQRGQDTGGTA